MSESIDRHTQTPLRWSRARPLIRRRLLAWAGVIGVAMLGAGSAGAVGTGDDLVFAMDERDSGTGIGEAGLAVGEIDQKHTDVRVGLVKTTAEGTVIFDIQLGEPDKIARKATKTKVKQSADLAMRIRVSDASATLNEADAARVEKCSIAVTFKDSTGLNSAQNLPDEATWKLVCDKGWHRDFEGLGDEARSIAKSVLGGEVKLKGTGAAADRPDVLTDLVFPLIDPAS